MKKLLKSIAYLLGFLVILLLSGFLYQKISTNSDKKKYSYPGQLVDVNGKKMHLITKGKTVYGIPTIVLIAGLGGTSPTWTLIQSELQPFALSVAFDRPGYGWSDASKDPRDGNSIALEIHQMLAKAGISPPYIIVGHSLGGLYARNFTALYPGEVKGLVLMESTHPQEYERSDAGKKELAEINKNLTMATRVAPFGLMRLNNMCILPADFPIKEANQIKSFCACTQNWKTQKEEMKSIGITTEQIKQNSIPTKIPLLVISGGSHMQDIQWKRFQEELSLLSTNNHVITVDNGTHTSLWSLSKDAKMVGQAIKNFVDSLSKNR